MHWAWVMSGAKGHEEGQMGLGVLEKWAAPVGRPGRASETSSEGLGAEDGSSTKQTTLVVCRKWITAGQS